MKLFTTLAVAALAQYAPDPATTEETTTIVPNTGLSCWHCDAKNMTECESIGEQKECADNAQVCMVEVRKRNGVLESVSINFPLQRFYLYLGLHGMQVAKSLRRQQEAELQGQVEGAAVQAMGLVQEGSFRLPTVLQRR